jgi:hypothetical protein
MYFQHRGHVNADQKMGQKRALSDGANLSPGFVNLGKKKAARTGERPFRFGWK